MPQAPAELTVIDAAYQLVVWGSERVAKFPRGHRFTVGQRLEGLMSRVLDKLLRAKYSRDRVALLREANMDLEVLRFQFRLAKDLKCLSLASYGHAARAVNDVGRMVGGWLKHAAGPSPADGPRRNGGEA
jgi:hypothetical protein